MTALLEFQRTMARAVMRPLSSRDNMKRGSEDGVALVKPNSRLSSFERLEIYNRSYWSRVLEAFSEDFPGVRALLGAKQFDVLRRGYLDDCPSESFTMRDLGRNLAAWMERNPALAGPHYGIALDMAKLEWAEIESFDAAGREPLDLAGIAALGPDSALQVQPHLRLLEGSHEVDTLLLEVRESVKRRSGAPRAIAARRIERAASSAPVYLAVHRFELVVHYKRIDAEMYRLLQAIAAGTSIAGAVEIAYAESALNPEQGQQHIHDSFAVFAALGWFCNSDQMKSEVPS
jgi:hypothetical protein